MREMFCYRLYTDYGVWYSPRITFCHLTIHVGDDSAPADYGIFYILEPIDEDFLKDRKELFGNHKGFLWKCGKGEASLRTCGDSMFGWDDNGEMDEKPYVLKTSVGSFETAKMQLNSFIDGLNNLDDAHFHDWIATVTDVPSLLMV